MHTVSWRGQDIAVPPLDLTDPEIFHRHAFFERASRYLAFNEIRGDYAEFGCASAKTFRLAYDALIGRQKLGCKLWAFDSFAGLPEPADYRDAHPKWTVGNYPTPLDLFELLVADHGIEPATYTAVPGLYCDTVGPQSNGEGARPQDIALAYVDCDLHSSTRDVLHFLGPRLKNGMLLAFDDYYCYAENAIAGERLALTDFLESTDRWKLVPYGEIGWHGQAFIVEDTRLRRAPSLPGDRR